MSDRSTYNRSSSSTNTLDKNVSSANNKQCPSIFISARNIKAYIYCSARSAVLTTSSVPWRVSLREYCCCVASKPHKQPAALYLGERLDVEPLQLFSTNLLHRVFLDIRYSRSGHRRRPQRKRLHRGNLFAAVKLAGGVAAAAPTS